MSTTEEKEIQEIIKKNLPAHVGDVLKQRLLQADEDAIKLVALGKSYDAMAEREKSLISELEKYKQFDERNSSLDNREKELDKRENKLQVDTLTYQLQSEKDKTKHASDLALGLVRNTSYRKNVFDNETGQGYYDQNNNWIQPNTSKSLIETREEE